MTDQPAAEVIEIAALDSPNLHPVTETVVAQTGEASAAPPSPSPEMSATQSAHTGAMPVNLLDSKGRPRVDRNGDPFDPARHAIDPNNPSLALLRTDGKLTFKADARRKGATSAAGSRLPPSATPSAAPPPSADGSVPQVAAPSPVDYREVAKSLVVPALGAVSVVLGHDEWSFERPEAQQYLDVTEQLCRKYNIDGQFPPELQLGMLMVSSVGARAKKPRTAAWLGRVKAWGAAQLVRMGWARTKKKPEPEPEKPPADEQPPADGASAAQ